MKKIISVALALMMTLSFVSLYASAAKAFIPEKVEIESAEYKFCTDESPIAGADALYDGVTGNNKTTSSDKNSGNLKNKLTNVAKNETSHGEKLGSSTYTWPLKEGETLERGKVKLDDNSELEYIYTLTATLKGAPTVGSIKFYMHGYKPGVLDRTFSILVSSDGQVWHRVFVAGEQTPLVDENTGLLTDEGQRVYVGAINTPGAAASEDNAAACVTAEFDAVENVQYVMWASNATRFNNGYYSNRFTEIEVWTGERVDTPTPPPTADAVVYFVAAAAVIVTAGTIVVIKKKEN